MAKQMRLSIFDVVRVTAAIRTLTPGAKKINLTFHSRWDEEAPFTLGVFWDGEESDIHALVTAINNAQKEPE